jgi:iron complex transport system substrate-binding protein
MSDLTLISRRRLLTAMALSPLLWKMGTAHAAAAIDPHRIVALEWLPVEFLLALGITPYGVADIPNYKMWVNEPSLPDSVIDIGLRTEPNLEPRVINLYQQHFDTRWKHGVPYQKGDLA